MIPLLGVRKGHWATESGVTGQTRFIRKVAVNAVWYCVCVCVCVLESVRLDGLGSGLAQFCNSVSKKNR